jgi:hypothetical protein
MMPERASNARPSGARARWAVPLRDAIRENMERIAAENGMEIEFVRSKKKFRREKRVKEVPDKRGEEPGPVCIPRAYSNGRSCPARQSSERQIEYRVPDKAFGRIAGFERARKPGKRFNTRIEGTRIEQGARPPGRGRCRSRCTTSSG